MNAPLSLATRLRLARLAIVVPPEYSGPEAADFAAHGADLLILTKGKRRAKEIADGIRVARNRLVGLQTIVAADHPEVAKEAAADALFFKRPGWRPFGIKRPHAFALLGRSIGGVADADKIDGDPFDFGFVGQAARGLHASAGIAEMADQHPPTGLPASPVWFAAGGISSVNIAAVVAAGARRVAVSTAIFAAADPFRETAAIVDVLDAAWDADPETGDYGMAVFR